MQAPAPAATCGVPVLFLIFNRPDTTARVFEQVRRARPPKLYVAGDGPRKHRTGEADVVQQVRRAVLDRVDWPCEVHTLLREENLGCRRAVSSAITWFFTHEERGIILEDDCLPSPSFFPFCTELLERHKDDERIAGITGDHRPLESHHPPDTYGLVGYPLIWGWASWRRVWQHYDVDMKGWTGDPDDLPRLAAKPRNTKRFLRTVFDAVKAGEIDTWDFQFNYLCQERRMDFLHPHVNLITNIGFGGQGTHTIDPTDPNAELPRGEVGFPLKGPTDGRAYEAWLDQRFFVVRSIGTKAMNRLYRWSANLLNRA
ncbi:MAG: nucleotide-diphospho-sugar transferase [Flavobacteriales bacterium]|jgi:hypothetical protein|nr:nucleotide-diphospho-sugar transferase [Flavobacteriales bacterium]